MFSFFKKKFLTPSTPAPDVMSAPAPEVVPVPATVDAQVKPLPEVSPRTPDLAGGSLIGSSLVAAIDISVSSATPPERKNWLSKLKAGLGKTASSISGVFGGSQIDEALFEDLESALLMADAGV
ncbi:MAG: signal recognition particle-docking protein FtsY, partial [Pseudomonadota bacterium]